MVLNFTKFDTCIAFRNKIEKSTCCKKDKTRSEKKPKPTSCAKHNFLKFDVLSQLIEEGKQIHCPYCKRMFTQDSVSKFTTFPRVYLRDASNIIICVACCCGFKFFYEGEKLVFEKGAIFQKHIKKSVKPACPYCNYLIVYSYEEGYRCRNLGCNKICSDKDFEEKHALNFDTKCRHCGANTVCLLNRVSCGNARVKYLYCQNCEKLFEEDMPNVYDEN